VDVVRHHRLFVGIDVSKDRLDIHGVPARPGARVAYDEAGVDRRAAHLRAIEPALIVMEATGGLEVRLATAWAGQGLPVAKVVIVACMRKLLTLMNSMIKNKTSWNPCIS
jgi:transposase